MGTVTFDSKVFVSLYPEFSAAGAVVLTAVFNQVTALYLDNTDESPVADLNEREQLLFLLVAHLCSLRGLGSGKDGQSGLVGRITSASEGSVSVFVDNSGSNDASWWYLQTPYGAAYWQATAPYRSMQYHPGGSPSRYPGHYYRRGRRW
ncbi:DUF4054 domain-containing protein [Salmonella enterica]|nr:DUF4054 domain-containing protein [Salmonella enterica]ELK3384816.1 DUF4054 domain-containing protein [Salmonella enterica]ELM2267707.1 DUF4054 domain-containing protein [Salmonella enterica]ELR2189304.1 DUF4054 domain-containing protein [Salmonella enterica]EME7567163.1 DUF4054 domain-containing protein [Salmonella enterica]